MACHSRNSSEHRVQLNVCLHSSLLVAAPSGPSTPEGGGVVLTPGLIRSSAPALIPTPLQVPEQKGVLQEDKHQPDDRAST